MLLLDGFICVATLFNNGYIRCSVGIGQAGDGDVSRYFSLSAVCGDGFVVSTFWLYWIVLKTFCIMCFYLFDALFYT